MISVAMAVYNGSLYITEQLDSILAQQCPVDEVVVVDDGSADGSYEAVQKYILDHPGAPLRLYRNEKNLGYKRNFRRALSLCTGDYIFLSDQDDVWLPEKTAVMLEVMKQNPEIRCLASSFNVIDAAGKPVQTETLPGHSNHNLLARPAEPDELIPMAFSDLLRVNSFQGCSLLITADLKDEFLEHFSDLLPHDWVINMIAAHDGGLYFYNRPLFCYRTHGKNEIGLPDAKPALKKKFRQIWQPAVRCRGAQERGNALALYKALYPEEYAADPENEALRDFCQKRVEALKNGDVKTLVRQNRSPYCAMITTPKARVMDVVFAVKQKLGGR